MRPRRIVLAIDAGGPLEVVAREVDEWRQWATTGSMDDLSAGIVVYGRRATWVPETTATLAGSAAVRGAGVAPEPALHEALGLVAAAEPDALVTLLAREPASGWEDALGGVRAHFRACVNLSREPAGALGRGHLGAPFRGEHIALALRWVTRELYDRTWRCRCGAVRVYPNDLEGACSSCGAAAEVPPRLRIGDRVVLMTPNARLYPHHVGRPLAFDGPLAELDGIARRAGAVSIAGVDAEIRTEAPSPPAPQAHPTRQRFRPPRLHAVPGQCHACDGALVGPALHRPPDPRRFCATCAAAEARCDFCNVPTGPTRGTTWPDGRTACRDCWTTAVTDAKALQALGAMPIA
jgi:hypothetical protein